MADRFFAKDHEYILMDGDIATVGISNYAQEQLGDVVFVELPEVGKQITRGDEAAIVESVKAASEVLAPVDGEVVEINSSLEDRPGLVNEDSEGSAWFYRMKIADSAQLGDLMSAADYKKFTETLD